MKELSIEEKAKAYDKAFEAASKIYANMKEGYNFGGMEDLEVIFPELVEGEDERMWKLIKKYAHSNISDMALNADHITRKQLESWLEKQGEKKHAELPQGFYYVDKDGNKYHAGNGYIKLKVNEPKQEWSEEDENVLEDIEEAIINYWHGDTQDILLDWLKSLKERVQPPNTWKPSEEHYELEEFAKIVRGNLTDISKDVQALFENKYLKLTGKKMYGGYKD